MIEDSTAIGNSDIDQSSVKDEVASGSGTLDTSLVPFSSTPLSRQSATKPDLANEVKLTAALTGLFDQVRAGPAAEALVPWVCDVLPSFHSRQAYFNDLRTFFLRMQEQRVSPFEVTGDHVRIYKEVIQQAGRRPATIARALSVIRGTYEQFGKKGLVKWNIVGDIRR